MRPLEILLIAVLLIRTCFTFTTYRKTKHLRTLVTFVASAVLLAQLYIEGWRWQLTPLYLAVFAAMTVDLTRLPTKLSDLQGGRSFQRAFLGIAGLALCTVLLFLMPIPKLPKPTGEYLVGTFSFEAKDKNRVEIYSQEETDRKLVVSIWYPAGSKTKRAPWIENSDAMLPAIAHSGGLPGWMLGHLKYIRTHAYQSAPVIESSTKLPVVFFEHGLQGFRTQDSFLVEDLASHGSVVIAIEHPYGAIKTVFTDGSSVEYSANVLPASTDPGYDAAAKRLAQQWSDDIAYMINYLSANPALPVGGLTEELELSKVALIGHSTGGASSLDFCAQHERCTAALLLDPWIQPVEESILTKGLNKPVVTLFSDPKLHYFSDSNAERYATLSANDSSTLETLTLLDSGHHNFDDTALLSPIASYFGHSVGKISPYRGFEIIRDYANALVNTYLLDKPSELLTASTNPFPEIQLAGAASSEPLPAETYPSSETPEAPKGE